ncbi:uncharacterized protein LOC106165146 [Lingula anatina]|uniref:Uncharacterized protein LOC106165146 n=1 Tax=Lingula anatina TaxID=7574 RepID=A0A1S3IKF9_LINAN|nr:uncharacterized protein LOC106165146 [Lingula anatina]|eukprot:XP_013398697.1 uncharacterized protein LOC106165146 [Lingula anatina]
MELVLKIRDEALALRTELELTKGKARVYFLVSDPGRFKKLQPCASTLKALTRSSEVDVLLASRGKPLCGSGSAIPSGSIRRVIRDDIVMFMDVTGLIDTDKLWSEMRLRQRQIHKELDVLQLQDTMSGTNNTSKIEKLYDQLEKTKQLIDSLESFKR